ncbi:hypothetical protein [Dietzia sp. CQ4]|uniref:hypothetical protein n=1 Tax=Dietzia sp. (strain CQ4) TaxID=370437 RepID=UPI001F505CC0|nr:hypothetical protein [Dietzia sp. CQ4]
MPVIFNCLLDLIEDPVSLQISGDPGSRQNAVALDREGRYRRLLSRTDKAVQHSASDPSSMVEVILLWGFGGEVVCRNIKQMTAPTSGVHTTVKDRYGDGV